MSDTASGDDVDGEQPLSRRTVIALIALLTLLPLATATVAFVLLTHHRSDPKFPPLEIGSCLEITPPDDTVRDVPCPSGNGRVISVGTSTSQCPTTARWGVVRDFHIYCVQRTARDPGDP